MFTVPLWLIILKMFPRTLLSYLNSASTLELYKGFQEEPYSVALHPLGLFILTSFADKLCFMNLLTDDIRIFKEFSVRGCREVSVRVLPALLLCPRYGSHDLSVLCFFFQCAFSHGGHMFAAVSGNIILIYSSVTFENTLSLKGHNGKVRLEKKIQWVSGSAS